MTVDVVTFGETMGRLTAPAIGALRHATHLNLSVAGAESNVAIGLARLGVAAHWTGRVGDDEFGQLIARILRAENVAANVVVDPEAPTGLLVKERRTSTSTRVQYYRTGSAGSLLSPDDLDADAIAEAGIVHATGITAAISASGLATCHAAIRQAREASTAVSFDLNHRRALWGEAEAAPVLRELASQADIVFATVDEARLIVKGDSAPELARAIAALGPGEVLIKDGARGAVGFVEGEQLEAPPFQALEVDPVGAGDAFAAGYLTARTDGAPAAARIELAARCGAVAVEVEGDWEGAPTRADLDLFGAREVRR